MVKLGPTGDFPEGKLGENDEGGITIGVTHKDGNVIIAFGTKVAWVGMLPDQAMELALTIMQRAKAIKAERD